MPEDNNKNNNTNRDNRMFTNNYLDNQRKLEEEKKNNLNNSSSNNSEEVIGTVEVKTTTTYDVDTTVKSTIETQVENQIKPDSFSGDKTISVKTSPVSSFDSSLNARPSSSSTQGSTSSVNGPSSSGAQGGNTMQNGASSPSDVNENVDNTPSQTNDLNKQSNQDVNQPENLDKQNDQNNNQSNNLDKHDGQNADQNDGKNEHTSGDNKPSENKNLDGTKPNSEKRDNQQDDNKQNKDDLNDKNVDQQNDPRRPLNQNHNNNLNNQNNQDYNPNNNLRKNRDFNNRQKNPFNNATNPNSVPNAADNLNKANDLKKKSDAANKAKQAADAANKAKKAADTAKKAETAVKTAKTAKALASWKIWLIVGVVLLILILFIVLLSAISGDLGGLTGLNGYTYVENNYPTTVEVIEVDGSTQHYNLEDYVAAVIANEAGFMTNSKYTNGIESLKAQAVAARTYAISKMTTAGKIYNSTNNQTNVSPSRIAGNSGHTFESVTSPESIFMQAANETRGLVLINDSGNLINAQYDAFAAYESCSGSRDDDYFYLCQMNQPIPKSWMDENAFQSNYYEFYSDKHHGNGMSQWGALYKAEQGSKFDEILLYYYGDHPVDEGRTNYKAQIYSIYRTVGMGVSQIDDYTPYITSTNSTIIPKPLNTIFDTNTLNTINNDIYANVLAAGPGTNEAVAIAATTLIKSFDNYGYKLPYSWAGGQGSSGSPYAHNDNLNTYYGINPFWGHQIRYTPPNGTTYRNVGLDCAGFVTWALRNAGVNVEQGSTGTYYDRFANEGVPKHKVDNYTGAVEGDILWNDGHIMIVLQYNASNKSYIVAEAMGNKFGILINTRSHSTLVEKNYYVYSMKDYYAAHKNENYEEDFNASRKV